MNIAAIAPVTPPAAPNSPPSSDVPASGFSEALAAELPDEQQAASRPESESTSGDTPVDTAAVTPPGEAPPQLPAMLDGAGTVAALIPGLSTGADTAIADRSMTTAGGKPAVLALQPAPIAAHARPGQGKPAPDYRADAKAGQAGESVTAVTDPGQTAPLDAFAAENTPGIAPAAAGGASAGTGSTAPAATTTVGALALAPAATTTAAVATSGLPQLDVALPLQHRDWAGQFSERVTFSIGKGLQAAELRISPEELGPISVRISLERNEASVSFVALHPQVREVIEQALPQLRDSLQQAGLQLGEASVSSGNQPHGQERGQQRSGSLPHDRATPSEEMLAAAPMRATTGRLLVDTYA